MDFSFSQEQIMAADVVRTLLADRCTGADLRRLMAGGEARDATRWMALCDMGLPGLLIPEESGGLGLSETDLVLIAEACAQSALPEPLVDHAGVGAPLLAGFANNPRAAVWLPRVATGEATVAVGHPVDPFVVDADSASVLLLTSGDGLHLVEANSVELVRQPSIDPFRRLFRVVWTPSEATLLADVSAARPHLDRALDRGALFAAAQGLGLAQRSVDIAAAFARERRQFDRPIGSYQAVKHQLATAQVAIEFARPVVHAAAAQIGQGDIYSQARISHAKLAALGVAEAAARTAIQVHGAMGYSWEVDVHFYLKRAIALAGAWGDEVFHRARFASRTFGAPLGPDLIFARGGAA